MVLLDDEGFAAFNHDPLRVHTALWQAVGRAPKLKPSPCLDLLPLPILPPAATVLSDDVRKTPPFNYRKLSDVVCSAMQGREMVVRASDDSLDEIQAFLLMTPASARASLEMTVGVKPASSRRCQLVWINGEINPDVKHYVTQGIELVDVATTSSEVAPPNRPEYNAWFALVREWWEQGRIEDIAWLSARISVEAGPDTLDRIVAVCRDCDEVDTASQERLEQLVTKYSGMAPSNEVEAEMVRQMISAAVRQASRLRQTVATE
jgi:hypothetical protein